MSFSIKSLGHPAYTKHRHRVGCLLAVGLFWLTTTIAFAQSPIVSWQALPAAPAGTQITIPPLFSFDKKVGVVFRNNVDQVGLYDPAAGSWSLLPQWNASDDGFRVGSQYVYRGGTLEILSGKHEDAGGDSFLAQYTPGTTSWVTLNSPTDHTYTGGVLRTGELIYAIFYDYNNVQKNRLFVTTASPVSWTAVSEEGVHDPRYNPVEFQGQIVWIDRYDSDPRLFSYNPVLRSIWGQA
jgi:hypothetical protein